jgi:aryl-alcohol dehydrogenase-like predicted oxidoreductase
MEIRKIGTSGLDASVVTFGAWAIGGWMWGGADRNDAIAAIHEAIDHGVTAIDTAPAYGQGRSEEIVGEALKGIDRSKIRIFTKFGLRWDTEQGEFFFKSTGQDGKPIKMYKLASKESIRKECEDSLRRLRTDYIDLYQIHWPDSTTPISETMEAMQELIGQGKIRAAGVCNYNVSGMTEAERTISLASNQVPYSMLNREIEKEIVPYVLEHNKAILAYSPLFKGLLTGKFKPGHKFNTGDVRIGNELYTDSNILRINRFLDKLTPLAEEKKATVGQLVIRWTVDQPGITLALVGARDRKQAIENAGAGEISLTKDEIGLIDNELRYM